MVLHAIKRALCIILWCLSWTHTFWVHVFVFFQILVKSWRNLFPISWPFITNPKWLQHYLQTYRQEALRIGSIIYLPRSSVKTVLCLHRWRWQSGEKVDRVFYWAAEWKKDPHLFNATKDKGTIMLTLSVIAWSLEHLLSLSVSSTLFIITLSCSFHSWTDLTERKPNHGFHLGYFS